MHTILITIQSFVFVNLIVYYFPHHRLVLQNTDIFTVVGGSWLECHQVQWTWAGERLLYSALLGKLLYNARVEGDLPLLGQGNDSHLSVRLKSLHCLTGSPCWLLFIAGECSWLLRTAFEETSFLDYIGFVESCLHRNWQVWCCGACVVDLGACISGLLCLVDSGYAF